MMNRLDERARSAADSARRLADTVDAEQVLARIEGRRSRPRWVVPAVALTTVAAAVLGVVVLTDLLGDDGLRIDDPVVQPDGQWPPAGYEAEDGWIRVDPSTHGIDGLPSDVVVFDGEFLLLDRGGRLWRSIDGVAWENEAGLNLPGRDLVVDRGRVVAMGVTADGRQLRVMWSENGADWNTVEDQDSLQLGPGEAEWADPQLVAGPRGFVIASDVWKQDADGAAANAGATIRVLESADGVDWSVTREWANTGNAVLTGLAGDTEGYTLVFYGDPPSGATNGGEARVFTSGDEGWTEVAGNPGGRPLRLAREQAPPVVGDGPATDDLATTSQRFHTWEWSLGEPNSGQPVFFRTATGWEEAVFEGPPTDQPGWRVNTIWDAGDALYAHITASEHEDVALYRSTDGYLWEALPREPVFAGAKLTGGGVVAATSGRTSVFALACCEPGVFDQDTHTEVWVRRAPAVDDPGTAGPADAPTSWERAPGPQLAEDDPPSTLVAIETAGPALIAFREHFTSLGSEGAFTTAGTEVWWTTDRMRWQRETPTGLAGQGRELIATLSDAGQVYALVQVGDTAQVWSSADGVSWEALPETPSWLAGGADGFRAVGMTLAATGPVIVGYRTYQSDGVSFTDAQPVAAVWNGDDWTVEAIDDEGRDRLPADVAVVDGEVVVVGAEQLPDGETAGVSWRRTADLTWQQTVYRDVSSLEHVTSTDGGWIAIGQGGARTHVVRGDGRGTVTTEIVELDGVRIFDLVPHGDAAIATGNTIASGPGDRPAVVWFGPESGAEVTWIADGGGLARGLTRVDTTLYVVGEATDRAEDGSGFVSRTAVWRGPIPGLERLRPDGPSPAPADCEAGDLSAEPEPQLGLPDAVQAMRVEIASALVRCDHGLLAELAESGDGSFTASFGGVDDLAAWFRDEADLRTLRLMLDMPWSMQGDTGDNLDHFVWPAAAVESTDETWQPLIEAGLATRADRAEMEEAFGAWVGWRIGIDDLGNWRFAVAGD